MPDTFTLIIELGNERMESRSDLAGAIREVANKVAASANTADPDWPNNEGHVIDINGNTVGRWELT